MKKIIPPFLFLFCISLMVILDWVLPSAEIFRSPIHYFGIVVVIMGLSMTIVVGKHFKKMETEIHTFKSPEKLVTGGLFKFSRNPIYLGFALSLIGVWIILGSILSVLGVILFVVVTNFWYIPYEEKMMRKKFGAAYEEYKSRVRRWI
ncbi:MAG TPA: isoprenylcysteine carboxylmethyltransferase family protein [Ohtaekwangia sp.]|nr:isoprenylcysteine carboxylmethyltransferase family protein [Ohtaekwangia sp.]